MDKPAPALTSLHKAYYGRSYAPQPPDPARCVEDVRGDGTWPEFNQCSRKRGHGPEEAYCRQHDPAAKAKRDREARDQWKAKTLKWTHEVHGFSAVTLLRSIAAGHNDPRTAAQEWLDARPNLTPKEPS